MNAAPFAGSTSAPFVGPFAGPASAPFANPKGSTVMGMMTGKAMPDAVEIARRSQELMDQSHDYAMQFDRYLWMDRRAIIRESGSRVVAEAVEGFTVRDPYELCFALFCLMDTGDDAPWLIRAGSSLMLYAMRMLPWHVEQDDWDDDDWDSWYDGLQYNRDGWLEHQTNKIRTRSSLWETGSDFVFSTGISISPMVYCVVQNPSREGHERRKLIDLEV